MPDPTNPALRPLVLVVLDGWGVAPPSRSNPYTIAKLPHYDELVAHYPAMTLQASGESVGLPWGEMGNSEVGHMNLGSGKIVYQSLPRINRAIANGSFFTNPAFLSAIENVQQKKSRLHLVGLMSSGGVHSFNEHAYALLELAKQQGVHEVFIHTFLDGRDTPSKSAENFIGKLQAHMKEVGVGAIATVIGRFWGMDRDNRWEREEKAYRAMVFGESPEKGSDPLALIRASYAKGVLDEEFAPTVITDASGQPVGKIQDGDSVITFNFRPDRMRQLTKAFVLPGFEKFDRGTYLQHLVFVTMTEYDKDLPVTVAFPPEDIASPVAKVISEGGLKQLHIAETEKYAHVTYFFNGGHEQAYPGEDHALIPSPHVSSYDQKPAMAARDITNRLVQELNAGAYNFYVVNYANADMVAHTGNFQATIEALEVLDECLGQLTDAVLAADGVLYITADHGNAEELLNLQTGAIDKEHSTSPVPFIAVANQWKDASPYQLPGGVEALNSVQPVGILADVAVTVLETLGLPVPPDMTGRNLLS
ncbi:MAG: 2,3-bisphosphoglycerate-independent phosphoglycerate mutase [Patescibacteria group bacterium]